jgi:hypothetical protein
MSEMLLGAAAGRADDAAASRAKRHCGPDRSFAWEAIAGRPEGDVYARDSWRDWSGSRGR